MKIAVMGTRGIPDIQGGVETHCEQLFPLIAAMGHDVTLFRRDCYTQASIGMTEYKGVKLVDVATPRRKSFEAIVHTWRCLMKARKMGVDLVHIHAIGPALLTPVARLLGMKVVVTHHGPDYDRAKWGRAAKLMLRTGERMCARYANGVIVISKVIDRLLHDKYGKVTTRLIYNGVPRADKTTDSSYISQLGVEPGRYVLGLGRFVPEKNFHQLIEAFRKASVNGYKLVIAGDADHADRYSAHLKALAAENGVVLPGFVKGEKLRQLMSNAALFVLPSSHEGLPISLLEAMSYGIDVLASDIPANKIDELRESDFFVMGDVVALTEAITRKLSSPVLNRHYDLSRYQWPAIARETVEFYKNV